jgi:hypothetical protein
MGSSHISKQKKQTKQKKGNGMIETNSLLYKKRLAKELNNRDSGFHVTNSDGTFTFRSSSARVSKGVLQVSKFGSYLNPLDPRNSQARWVDADDCVFSDDSDRKIVASRKGESK